MDLCARDYDFIRALVARATGVNLGPDRDYLVLARLGPLVRERGYPDLAPLVRDLRAGSPALREQVLEALATHETYFFRDVHPFQALREHILAPLLRAGPGSGRAPVIWSAAAATGQEPYSVAMLIAEHFPPEAAVTLLASDFSPACIHAAVRGSYSQLEVNRGLPAPLLVRYFDRDGLDWRLQARIRDRVTFRVINLVQPLPVLPLADVILLRNVMTYFDLPTRQAVLTRVLRQLRPGGHLILGGSESLLGLSAEVDTVRFGRTVCYRRQE